MNLWIIKRATTADNRFGHEGFCALSKALKTNTVLTELNLEGEQWT